jgi:hypothetical protein
MPEYHLPLFGVEGDRLDEVVLSRRTDGVEVAGQAVYLDCNCLCFLELFF